jgi:hypothetical protein
MIKGFQQPQRAEPIEIHRLQGVPALAAGLIAGVVMLIVPHASPWEGLTTFTPAIMGRVPPAAWNLGTLLIIIIHLALSLIYGFIISLAVLNIRELRAVFTGGVIGLILYLLNLGAVTLWFPALRGNEVSVIVTHGVFGLIAAGVYRGLLRRRVPVESNHSNPPAAPPVA